MYQILVVEDDEVLRNGIVYALKKEGFQPLPAGSLKELKEELAKEADLILLDVSLPDGDSRDYLKRLRQTSRIPVIFLTARNMERDMIEGFNAGADDYITKPFSKTVLVSKIQAIVRRTRQYVTTAESIQSPIQKGPFTLHMNSQTIFKHGKEIALTSKGFALLCLFMDHPGHTFSKQELFQEVWKNDGSDNNTILVYIKKLRGKIEDDPSQPFHIRTVWGKGYQFFL